jgi:hypothetical protein
MPAFAGMTMRRGAPLLRVSVPLPRPLARRSPAGEGGSVFYLLPFAAGRKFSITHSCGGSGLSVSVENVMRDPSG